MLGYGKPDDSPASNAKFVDMYQTLNSDAQRKYADVGSDTANKYIQMAARTNPCLLYTSPSPRDRQKSRMPSSA